MSSQHWLTRSLARRCLVHLKRFNEAVDAARKANTPQTWKEVCFACVAVKEFKLAQLCGLNIITSTDELNEVRPVASVALCCAAILATCGLSSRIPSTAEAQRGAARFLCAADDSQLPAASAASPLQAWGRGPIAPRGRLPRHPQCRQRRRPRKPSDFSGLRGAHPAPKTRAFCAGLRSVHDVRPLCRDYRAARERPRKPRHFPGLRGAHPAPKTSRFLQVCEVYMTRGHFAELIALLESGIGLERAHMGIFTALGEMYANHAPEKLMEHLKLFCTRVNIPRLISICERQMLWKELTFLYEKYDEFDNALDTMMAHDAIAWEHVRFKDVAVKCSTVDIFYKAIQHYFDAHPELVVDLLKVPLPSLLSPLSDASHCVPAATAARTPSLLSTSSRCLPPLFSLVSLTVPSLLFVLSVLSLSLRSLSSLRALCSLSLSLFPLFSSCSLFSLSHGFLSALSGVSALSLSLFLVCSLCFISSLWPLPCDRCPAATVTRTPTLLSTSSRCLPPALSLLSLLSLRSDRSTEGRRGHNASRCKCIRSLSLSALLCACHQAFLVP